ncbi:heterokaryon incompatibility protein-domain-containing protein [Plectosphaerella plurivora]|uniref:Heterokaryon incompatibility protein-domain-containing protein n=1 Tax=Plectosphaerella plurivora TaxID=936078 RepID=A0A9P8VKJ0_9PEZI|nr:heterokaryon incompatibility protein-domain-containing protein [Plectosphaerella plurivora]
MGPYVYRELRKAEIRLATLHPGAQQDDIRLSIEHVPLIASGPRRQPTMLRIQNELPADWEAHEEQPKRLYFQHLKEGRWEPQWAHPDPEFDMNRYEKPRNPVSFEALSYTWGDSTTAEEATIVSNPEKSVQEPSETSTLPLSYNLAQAIRCLRYDDRPRTLWVDAICINQQNRPEVDVQVARAGTVYEEASRVVIWLGPETHDSSLAISKLDYLGSQVMANSKHILLSTPDATETDWHLRSTPLPYDPPTWTAIDSLLRRPWFTRVWVQQELHLADQAIFVCGKDEISREKLWRATLALSKKNVLSPAVSRTILTSTKKSLMPFHSSSTIFQIFNRVRRRQCKDKRDLVYGALGLFPPSFRSLIAVDYSLSIDEVYANFVRVHSKHVRRLEMLRNCTSGVGRVGVPSWLPDFSSRSTSNAMLGTWHFSAGHSACHVEFRGPILDATGVEVDALESVSELIPLPTGRPDGTVEAAVQVIRWLIAAFQAENAGTNLGSRPDNWIWNLVGKFLYDRLPSDLIGKHDELRQILRTSKVFGSGDSGDVVEGQLSYPEGHCLDLLTGRRVTSTKQGHRGIAPADAQPGDIIACFLGCDSPIALRPTSGGYLVVGECFMPAYADLRAFLGPLKSPWKVRFFTESSDGAGAYRYLNTDTGELSDQDPRLDPLPRDLEVVPRDKVVRTGDDPGTFQVYRSRKTGEVVTKSDPMLTPELLEARGCQLRRFSLV